MSLAERTRDAIRREPFVHEALRAGVINYSAAARFLDVDGDQEAIATALRRYADELDPIDEEGASRPTVRMRRGVDIIEADANDDGPPDKYNEALLVVGERAVVDGGDRTALVVSGGVEPDDLASVLVRLAIAGISVDAAGATGLSITIVVGPGNGANALRIVEDELGG